MKKVLNVYKINEAHSLITFSAIGILNADKKYIQFFLCTNFFLLKELRECWIVGVDEKISMDYKNNSGHCKLAN